MLCRTTQVANKLGLHLRSVSVIVQTALKFHANVTLAKDCRKRNGRSVFDLMLLDAGPGTTLTIEVDGDDESEAMEAILKLFNGKFGKE
jgi:phosphocarrier protein HPr